MNTTPVRAVFRVRPMLDPSETSPLPPSAFWVSPESGVVEPNCTFSFTFYFQSHTVKEYACQRFQVSTPGGTPLVVTCKAFCRPIDVLMSARSINFGEVPSGKTYSRTLQLHNKSDRPAPYHFVNVEQRGPEAEGDNQDWTLFCPNEAFDETTGKGLMDVWGEEFDRLYEQLEQAGKGRKTMKAQQLWFRILEAQMETGTPYMLSKSTDRGSNLCTEIIEYTSEDEVAVCNLASVALSAFAKEGNGFDFHGLYEVTKVATRNLNLVIDRNHYPIPEARKSNMRHRPIGLGVQGLADAFLILRMPFESDEARQLNEDIFETMPGRIFVSGGNETERSDGHEFFMDYISQEHQLTSWAEIYFAACEASCELAKCEGPYETFQGSPASKGKLQFDLWGRKPKSGRWDWDGLKELSSSLSLSRFRERIARHGLRNSLLVAPMPTASTAQILGNNESFEPYTQNLYVRRTLSGEFVTVNRHLLKDLINKGLWTEELRTQLIAHNGSVQRLDLPQESQGSDMKDLYKTVWEIRQKRVLDLAADRGAYIDQSQSLNIHMMDPWPKWDTLVQNASRVSFAAIVFNGSVVTWGDERNGGDSSAVQAQLKNVRQIQSTDHAFAAILVDGSVVTWGLPAFGGDSSAVQDQLKHVQQIQASSRTFAALLDDGSVVAWGGTFSDDIALQDQLKNVRQIQATGRAFAAILCGGSVVTWGSAGNGGSSSAVQDQLKNVQQVQATARAFAAILGDGSVVSWGDADFGGDSNAVQDQLKNVQQIQAAHFACAATLVVTVVMCRDS
eukprot:s867_g7.t1